MGRGGLIPREIFQLSTKLNMKKFSSSCLSTYQVVNSFIPLCDEQIFLLTYWHCIASSQANITSKHHKQTLQANIINKHHKQTSQANIISMAIHMITAFYIFAAVSTLLIYNFFLSTLVTIIMPHSINSNVFKSVRFISLGYSVIQWVSTAVSQSYTLRHPNSTLHTCLAIQKPKDRLVNVFC